MQFDGLIAVVDFRLRLNARVGVTITTQQFLDVVFHLGYFRAVVQFARLDFGQRFDFGRMAREIARYLHPGKLVLIAFGDVDGNVDPFLVRRQANLSRIDVETGITAIQIVAAQGFKVARQLLLLVFTVADHVPPRYLIAQLEVGDQFIGRKRMVADDIDLLNFCGDAFLEDQLQIDTVTRQRRHNRFDAGAVFTDAVVEILQTLLDIRDGRAVKRLAHPNA